MCRVASRSRVPLSGAGRGQHRLCVGGLFNNKQTVCGRFITNRSARASKDHRCIFGLQTSSHSPGPRCVTRQQTDFVPKFIKKFFIKKTAQSVGPRDWTEGEVRSAYRSVLNRAGALCSIAHTRGAWLPAATCRGCPGAEPMGKHRAHERACRAWSSHMRLST